MAEIDEKLSEMTQRTGTMTASDLLYICIVDMLSDTGFSSRKDNLGNFANGLFDDLEFPLKLDTASKSIFGAINELAQSGGGSIRTGTTAPSSDLGSNGELYVQYTEGVSPNPDTVDALFVKLDGEWCEIATGSGPAETVLTETLEAGQTSVTFTDAAITTGSNIRILTSVFGLTPTGATASTGSLTVTFAAQLSDVDIKAVIY